MDKRRRLSDMSELPADVPEPRGLASTGSRDATNSEKRSAAQELPAGLGRPSSAASSKESLIGGPKLKDDGRVEIDFNSKLVRAISALYRSPPIELPDTPPPEYSESPPDRSWTIAMNIVIQVVGSRGDVQPFIALGNELRRCGHRVRLATHDIFEKFVRDSGLEFYPIGGNPSELMAYMVKNPGLLPSMKTLRAGEVKRKRLMVMEMLEGCWRSCLEPDTLTHEPFVADAIIANPPSFAHVHCAQALGIPVHLMFTMPWTSTKSFPHPLVNMRNARDRSVANYMSYGLVEWMTWQGLGDIINQWRRSLDLEEIAMFDGPNLAMTLKVPFTYCWSPALVPKPADWPSYIDVCGFFFRDPPQYEPPPELRAFIDAGPTPVYIGFGSIVLEDPHRITAAIFQAVDATGIRAIVSRGWSNLGAQGEQHDNILFIGDCPHEWLFQHVAAVIHHGGAGTTACGLRNGKPTTVVPFFGDQPFWGQMIAAAGAGPIPIPQKDLTAESLAEAIRYCLSSEAVYAARDISQRMQSEAGVEAAVRSFHRNLPLKNLPCDILPNLPAVWSFSKKTTIKLSSLAAEIVLSKEPTNAKYFKLYECNPIAIETSRWDPVTGGASAVLATAVDLTTSVTGVFTKPISEYRQDRDRRAYEDASAEVSSNAEIANNSTSKSNPRPENATPMTCPPSAGSDRKGISAGRMTGSSAMSLVCFVPKALKGMTVDIPLALTEGLRSVPRHYGDTVRDHGRVTDWKSGAAVAGKTFAWGMAEGVSDIVVKPYQGAKEEGMKGVAKGLGKGVVSMTTKTGAGMLGLAAYTSAGIAKSLRATVHTGTRQKIAEARHMEGRWKIGHSVVSAAETDAIMTAFEALRKGKQ